MFHCFYLYETAHIPLIQSVFHTGLFVPGPVCTSLQSGPPSAALSILGYLLCASTLESLVTSSQHHLISQLPGLLCTWTVGANSLQHPSPALWAVETLPVQGLCGGGKRAEREVQGIQKGKEGERGEGRRLANTCSQLHSPSQAVQCTVTHEASAETLVCAGSSRDAVTSTGMPRWHSLPLLLPLTSIPSFSLLPLGLYSPKKTLACKFTAGSVFWGSGFQCHFYHVCYDFNVSVSFTAPGMAPNT